MSVQLIQEQVRLANESGTPLRIEGGGSKKFLGHSLDDLAMLDTRSLQGVMSYDPAELVIRVAAGTPLVDVINVLAEQGQMLAFDPPVFDGATIGGTVAAGLSGSRRPYAGSVRDFVLGVGLIDGQAKYYEFGGQVMKNVAGYDVSRLVTGAMGCLGVIADISFKVLPKPESEVTVKIPCNREQAIDRMRELARTPNLTAMAWHDNALLVRLGGMAHGVERQSKELEDVRGGEVLNESPWARFDNFSFTDSENLWRLGVTPDSQAGLEDAVLIDWGGAQRWLTSVEVDAAEFPERCNLTNIRGAADTYPVLPPLQRGLHEKLKQQFDPAGILNPNKMYEGV